MHHPARLEQLEFQGLCAGVMCSGGWPEDHPPERDDAAGCGASGHAPGYALGFASAGAGGYVSAGAPGYAPGFGIQPNPGTESWNGNPGAEMSPADGCFSVMSTSGYAPVDVPVFGKRPHTGAGMSEMWSMISMSNSKHGKPKHQLS